MKEKMSKSVFIILTVAALTFAGCNSTNVERVSASSETDISGYWNDTDVRIVAEDLIDQCISARWYSDYIKLNKRKPVVILGRFRNNSDEHLDASIILKKFEMSLIKTGKVSFVASSSERKSVRRERDDQQINSSLETAKNIGNETAADYMLQGEIKTIVDSNGKKTARVYYVSAELIDIETNEKVWLGENASVKKIITRSSVRF